MKKSIFTILLFALMITLAPAYTPRFGVGINIGSPTGLSVKYWLNAQNAIAFNAGWSFWQEEHFHLTGDYLFHFRKAVPEDPRFIPYLGVGGSLAFRDHPHDPDTHVALGFRFGGGLEVLLEPVGIFAELFPVLYLVPATDVNLEGGIGVRIYFPIRSH